MELLKYEYAEFDITTYYCKKTDDEYLLFSLNLEEAGEFNGPNVINYEPSSCEPVSEDEVPDEIIDGFEVALNE